TIGDDAGISLADHFGARLKRAPRQGDVLPLGTIALVAHRVADGRVTSVGLRLADEEPAEAPTTWLGRLKSLARRMLAKLG
ncbi:MAG: potassium/proton antiporter, partial [Xanthobacteraceae bacterium]